MKAKSRRDVGVIIAGGGKGVRMGGNTPKQFRTLGGIPLLARTIALFAHEPAVAEIVLVVPERFIPRAERIARNAGARKVTVVPGGADRQDSVWNGLHAFTIPPPIVVVHDAVRPFAHSATFRAVVRAARAHGAAVPGVKLHDTVKEEAGGFIARTLPRERLYAIQTPQAFRFDLLMQAHTAARNRGFRGTDDAGLLEQLGLPVCIVPGRPENLKITTPIDMRLAALLARL